MREKYQKLYVTVDVSVSQGLAVGLFILSKIKLLPFEMVIAYNKEWYKIIIPTMATMGLWNIPISTSTIGN